MINWRSIKEVGCPTDEHKSYLVTDGKEISTSDIDVNRYYGGDNPRSEFRGWTGDGFTYEDNSCCSGERIYDMRPTHWCPTDEIELP